MLNEQNKERLRYLVDAYEQENISDGESHSMKKEIMSIQQGIKINEDKRNEVVQSLYGNLKQKQALQKEMESIKDEKQRDLLELQIALRSLKLEKMDLFVQNMKFRQQAKEAQIEINNKDKIITQMQQELNSMKEQLGDKTPVKVPPLQLREIENISPIHIKQSSPFLNESFNKFVKEPEIFKTSPVIKPKIPHNLKEARLLRKVGKMNETPARKTVEFLSKFSSNNTERPLSAAPRQGRNDSHKAAINKQILENSHSSGPKKGVFSNLHSVTSRNSSADKRYTASSKILVSEKVINKINKLDRNVKPLLKFGLNRRVETPNLLGKINMSSDNFKK